MGHARRMAVPAGAGGAQRLVREYGIDVARLPAVIFRDGSVLHQPNIVEVAAGHGVHTRPSADVHELAIVGAGPAGLAAAGYGAAEGLRTLVMECQSLGGGDRGRPRISAHLRLSPG